MREVDLADHLQGAAFAEGERCRGPFADAVHRQDCRAPERRGIEGARCVAQVMLGKEQLGRPIGRRIEPLQLPQERVSLEQLVLHPQRERMAKGREPARRERQIRLEQPLELQERLVVEGDVIELCRLDAGDLQAGLDRVLRKRRVVLLAREALLLGRGDDFAIDDQRRRGIVVVGRDAEDAHTLEKRVYEGRNHRALCEDQQSAQ